LEYKTPQYWYSYGVFRFASHQIIWALSERESFAQGRWPEIPTDQYTGDHYSNELKEWITTWQYSGGKADDNSIHLSGEGSFAKASIVWADLESRLAKTKDCGKALLKEVDIYYGKLLRLPTYKDLGDLSKLALNYISGPRARKQTFAQWRADRKYKAINLLPCTS
jgi:hypothetical protein